MVRVSIYFHGRIMKKTCFILPICIEWYNANYCPQNWIETSFMPLLTMSVLRNGFNPRWWNRQLKSTGFPSSSTNIFGKCSEHTLSLTWLKSVESVVITWETRFSEIRISDSRKAFCDIRKSIFDIRKSVSDIRKSSNLIYQISESPVISSIRNLSQDIRNRFCYIQKWFSDIRI